MLWAKAVQAHSTGFANILADLHEQRRAQGRSDTEWVTIQTIIHLLTCHPHSSMARMYEEIRGIDIGMRSSKMHLWREMGHLGRPKVIESKSPVSPKNHALFAATICSIPSLASLPRSLKGGQRLREGW